MRAARVFCLLARKVEPTVERLAILELLSEELETVRYYQQ